MAVSDQNSFIASFDHLMSFQYLYATPRISIKAVHVEFVPTNSLFADLRDGFQESMKVRVKRPKGEIPALIGAKVLTKATLKCAF